MECYDVGYILEHLGDSYILCDFAFLYLYFTAWKILMDTIQYISKQLFLKNITE